MNCPALLSKDPRGILDDERALLVLSLLERAGLAKTSDLAQMAGMHLNAARKMLTRLQAHGLVERGANHVRLTGTGGAVVERFSLNDEVIEDVLDALAAHDGERKDFRLALETYRRRSFRLYLNCLCAMRQWSLIVDELPDAQGEGDRALLARAGMRTLFIRHMHDWHSYGGGSSSGEAGAAIVRLISIDVSEQGSVRWWSPPGRDLSGLTQACLSAVLVGWRHESLVSQWFSSMCSLLRGFVEFRESWGPDIWFDRWIVECKDVARAHPDPNSYFHDLEGWMVRGRRKRPSTRARQTQGVVAPIANKKVLVRAASQSNLEGLYATICTLLDAALAHAHSRIQLCQSLNFDPMEAMKLATDDSRSVHERVAKLFELVAMLSGISELLHLVRNMNERLRRARVAEVKVLTGVIEELVVLCDLYAKGDTESLRAALETYHDRRQKSVHDIYQGLVLASL